MISNYKLARKIKSILNSDYKISIFNNNDYYDLFNLNNVSYEYAFNKLYGNDPLSLLWQDGLSYIEFKRLLYTVAGSIREGTVIVCNTKESMRALEEMTSDYLDFEFKYIEFDEIEHDNYIFKIYIN